MDLYRYIAMGDYTGYVWGVYGITASALGVIIWFAKRRLANELKNARRQQSSEDFHGKD